MANKTEQSNKVCATDDLLASKLEVVNVGLETFAAELRANGVAVQHCVWRPPGGGDKELANQLAEMGA